MSFGLFQTFPSSEASVREVGVVALDFAANATIVHRERPAFFTNLFEIASLAQIRIESLGLSRAGVPVIAYLTSLAILNTFIPDDNRIEDIIQRSITSAHTSVETLFNSPIHLSVELHQDLASTRYLEKTVYVPLYAGIQVLIAAPAAGYNRLETVDAAQRAFRLAHPDHRLRI